jgi:hypothetical protein
VNGEGMRAMLTGAPSDAAPAPKAKQAVGTY